MIEKYGQTVPTERLRRLQDLPVEFQTREDFERSYVEDGGTPGGKIYGYVRENSDLSPPHVALDQESLGVKLATAHERTHQLADPEAKTALGKGLYEGVTELLAEDVVLNPTEHGGEVPPTRLYPLETSLARNFSEIAGREAVEAAYFKGDTEALREKIDQSLGKGTLESFGAKAKEWDDLPPEGSGS